VPHYTGGRRFLTIPDSAGNVIQLSHASGCVPVSISGIGVLHDLTTMVASTLLFKLSISCGAFNESITMLRPPAYEDSRWQSTLFSAG
jgi:hypothetical protein